LRSADKFHNIALAGTEAGDADSGVMFALLVGENSGE
jgi:hypothetical protein